MSDLLDKWLAHYDPIHRGWTRDGIANAVCTTAGWFFPRIAGGYNLRRAVGGKPELTDLIAGAAPADAEQIANFPWIAHEASTVYYYRLNAIGAGGVEEQSQRNVRRVEFDAAGTLVGPRPNGPSHVQVAASAGGRFDLRWRYAWPDEEVPPAAFRIYSDGGTGTMDYVTPVATVPHRVGKADYRYTSAPFAHGTAVQWAVRAAAASGLEEKNDMVVAAKADATGPPAVGHVAAERGRETHV